MKILIADDHPMIRTAIEVLLRDTGLTIAGSATTGEEAMRVLDEVKPDLLLLDLQMPEGSGMDVLRRVRASGRVLRVVVLTAVTVTVRVAVAVTVAVPVCETRTSPKGVWVVCSAAVVGCPKP